MNLRRKLCDVCGELPDVEAYYYGRKFICSTTCLAQLLIEEGLLVEVELIVGREENYFVQNVDAD